MAQAQSGDGVTKIRISDFVGRIELRNEDVTVPVVTVEEGELESRMGLEVLEAGGDVSISMAPTQGNISCVTQNSTTMIMIGERKPALLDSFPSIVVTAPVGAEVELSMIAGEARLSSVSAMTGVLGGCSRIEVDTVSGPTVLDISSGARVNIASLHDMELRGAGGAKMLAGSVVGQTRLDMSGGASFSSREVRGDLTSRQDGSSRVEISDGEIGTMDLDLSRVARFAFGGVVDTLGVSAADVARIEIGAATHAPEVRSRGRGSRLSIGGEELRAG